MDVLQIVLGSVFGGMFVVGVFVLVFAAIYGSR